MQIAAHVAGNLEVGYFDCWLVLDALLLLFLLW